MKEKFWADDLMGMALRAGAVLLFGAALILLKPPCLIRTFFGVPCPGCGMGRAASLALHGAFREAVLMHPMVVSLPVIGLLLVRKGKLFGNRFLDGAVYVLLTAGFIGQYIWKMLR